MDRIETHFEKIILSYYFFKLLTCRLTNPLTRRIFYGSRNFEIYLKWINAHHITPFTKQGVCMYLLFLDTLFDFHKGFWATKSDLYAIKLSVETFWPTWQAPKILDPYSAAFRPIFAYNSRNDLCKKSNIFPLGYLHK